MKKLEDDQVEIESVKNCARCGGDHDNLVFKPLSGTKVNVYVNVRIGMIHASHWAPCPTNGEPILLAKIKLEKQPPTST